MRFFPRPVIFFLALGPLLTFSESALIHSGTFRGAIRGASCALRGSWIYIWNLAVADFASLARHISRKVSISFVYLAPRGGGEGGCTSPTKPMRRPSVATRLTRVVCATLAALHSTRLLHDNPSAPCKGKKCIFSPLLRM